MKQDLDTMRHSAAHLLAAAVKNLFPNTSLGIGPIIEDGFYYDFASDQKLSAAEFPRIEKEIERLKKEKIKFERIEKPIKDGLVFAKNLKEPFKIEIIEDLEKQGEKQVTFYKTGSFVDLCTGPHVQDSSKVGEVKLLSVAGAYWRGSEKNKMLQRVYGTAWFSKKDLDEYITRLDQTKERDHRKLGKELDLFVFSDLIGKGLPLLTPKGSTIRRELERFVVDEELKKGYEHVYTPSLAKTDLYRTSGHYPYYKETMYQPMKVDDDELILRPMTCPHHFMLFKARPRSYRELPLKLAEISPQFRYEKSGELLGLSRVRSFTLTDAHIFTSVERVEETLDEVLNLINDLNSKIGFEKGVDYRYRLSLGDRGDESKYYKDDKSWESSEAVLRNILKVRGEPFFEAVGEAAFYGPKIDIQMKNVLGKEETVFTVQYDFVMPERFDLQYVDDHGKEKRPVVIHRSSIGAIERVMAFLIEKTGGNFPLWLAPLQAIIIPISERHIEYSKEVRGHLREQKIRVAVDDRNQTLQAKIRDAQMQKTPYMLVVGDKEQVQRKVSVRSREKSDNEVLSIEEFSERVLKEISLFK